MPGRHTPTLARIAGDRDIGRRYSALAQAAGHAATPHVRDAATIGGNLLQRPRCWYFRSEYFHQPGASGGARERESQYHAIFDNARTAMVHASTPARALVAYGARVELAGVGGKTRTLAVSDLLLPPQICDVAGVTPLSRNRYKVPVLEAVVRRTILAAA